MSKSARPWDAGAYASAEAAAAVLGKNSPSCRIVDEEEFDAERRRRWGGEQPVRNEWRRVHVQLRPDQDDWLTSQGREKTETIRALIDEAMKRGV